MQARPASLWPPPCRIPLPSPSPPPPRQLLSVPARPSRMLSLAPPRAAEEGFELSVAAAGEGAAPEESEEDITAAYEQMYGKPGASQRTEAGAGGEDEEEAEEAPAARGRSGGGRREGGRGGRGPPSEFSERVLQVRPGAVLREHRGTPGRSSSLEPGRTKCGSLSQVNVVPFCSPLQDGSGAS